MEIDTHTGLLQGVRYLASPNCDDRPINCAIDLVVIHNISLPPQQYGGPYIDQLFTNQLSATAHPFFATIATLQVSAHLLIQRDGAITQYVPFHRRAWHAGVSSYHGRERCNDFSIGIELEGSDFEPFCEKQYQQLTVVLQALIQAYPAVNTATITGHADIAPGRKSDPGPYFAWDRLHSMLQEGG